MDKILDLFLRSPLAKRYIAGYVERGLLIGLTALASYAQFEAGSYESDVAQFAAEWGPLIAGAAVLWISKLRMKKAEMTIKVAQASDPDLPRSVINARVDTILAAPKPVVVK
jgi:hypothetical protein